MWQTALQPLPSCLLHVTEELSSLTFALHFCFVPDGIGRAHASVSCSGGGGRGQQIVCVPKIDLQVRAPLINLIFSQGKIF